MKKWQKKFRQCQPEWGFTLVAVLSLLLEKDGKFILLLPCGVTPSLGWPEVRGAHRGPVRVPFALQVVPEELCCEFWPLPGDQWDELWGHW